MNKRETWPPAILARSLENRLLSRRAECSFDPSKENQMVLIPGMGASAAQMFELVHALRSDGDFGSYGVTAVQMGHSMGDFSLTFQRLFDQVETGLEQFIHIKKLVLFGHSHGGRFASQLATELQRRYPALELCLITAGTPIVERPKSFLPWLASLSFRQWPNIDQPELAVFYAFYSSQDEVVDEEHATEGAEGTLRKLGNFTHRDFIRPEKMVPELKKLIHVYRSEI